MPSLALPTPLHFTLQITAAKNEALDVAAVVAQYQREVAALKAQLAALSGAWSQPVSVLIDLGWPCLIRPAF